MPCPFNFSAYNFSCLFVAVSSITKNAHRKRKEKDQNLLGNQRPNISSSDAEQTPPQKRRHLCLSKKSKSMYITSRVTMGGGESASERNSTVLMCADSPQHPNNLGHSSYNAGNSLAMQVLFYPAGQFWLQKEWSKSSN